jgi:hypothetical protein
MKTLRLPGATTFIVGQVANRLPTCRRLAIGLPESAYRSHGSRVSSVARRHCVPTKNYQLHAF